MTAPKEDIQLPIEEGYYSFMINASDDKMWIMSECCGAHFSLEEAIAIQAEMTKWIERKKLERDSEGQ